MGQSKTGYKKLPAVSGSQRTFLEQLLQQAGPNLGQAAEGYANFLPGGSGTDAFINAAQQRFQQQTIPSIMNAFGSGAKSSSALNQALAAGGANLNTDIAQILAQAQLQAASGLGNLGLGMGSIGAQTPFFAYQQKQRPFWQSALLAGIGGSADFAGSVFGKP